MARRHLEGKLYKVVAANVRLPSGEVDLIAQQSRVLVFVEVKTRRRSTEHLFDPLTAVDDSKRKRLRRVAARYIMTHYPALRRRRLSTFRFDIVAVYYEPILWRFWRHVEFLHQIGDELRLTLSDERKHRR